MGLELECSFYNELESALRTESNLTVVSGFQDRYKTNGDENQHFELDFLIISASKETIFHVEVKNLLTRNSLKAAKEQLEHGFK